nr:TLRdelta [Terebratalia transversa]
MEAEEDIFQMDDELSGDNKVETTSEYHISDGYHRHKCDYLNTDSNPRARFRSHTSQDMTDLQFSTLGVLKEIPKIPDQAEAKTTRRLSTDQTIVGSLTSPQTHDELIEKTRMSHQLYVTSDIAEECLTQMKSLPDGFRPLFDILHIELESLKLLSLSHLDLKRLPDNVQFPPNLEILYLTGNALTTLPTGAVLHMPKLKVLHLGSNIFKVIPFRAVSYLHNLESLDMTNNVLEDPVRRMHEIISLSGMEKLTTICLASNCLGSVPPEIMSARNLKQLDMSYNKISSIPPEIGGLKELRYLNMKSNRLRQLPNELCQLKHLEIVCFSENTISDPNVDELLDMPDSKIKMLCLHSNRIPANKVQNLLKKASRSLDIRLAENCVEETREHVKQYLKKCLAMDENAVHKWDVLILHDDKDEEIIENEIRPKLEEEMDFRVCIPYRDETMGMSKVAERSNLINFSKTIMLVITEKFNSSKILGLDEVLMLNGLDSEEDSSISIPTETHHETPSIKSTNKCLIPVLWSKGVQVPKELKGRTMVRRDSDVQEKYFWQKIRKAIQSHC